MARWVVCSTVDCAQMHQGSGRCPDCRHEFEKARGSSTARGYGQEHRKAGDKAIKGATHCAHCGQPFTIDNPVVRGHVVAIRDGGTPADGYAPHCRHCNSAWLSTGL